MQITLYHRTFPVADAPFAVSFVPPDATQRHTFSANGKVYEAEFKEVHIVVPDGATFDPLKNLLGWAGDKGPMKSTAKEVYELARTKAPGFKMVK
jgi:hypothetical protein